ncbi:DUF916 domain-containing protein [Georgenia sp. 311]|uniref:DUF916 domain-containing protein n=1 Tax=Georgenia wutianyii TaxID=2585135 RepID=A0ABX5VQ08_9MICO|nr:DUF916 domain-containing protein [Georgenia wutianyii]TNC16974.1 DUF916 domain-containing protein [Georgenia sp. 311]
MGLPVTTAPRPALRVALVSVLALLAALLLSAPVAAQTQEPAVRWSTTPADENGPDGRRAVEHTLDPGEVVEEHLAVRNVSSEEVTFSLDAADGFYTRTGRFDMLASGEESVGAGTWITLPETVTVAAGETEVVPFTIEVPPNTEPGDHAAGITASVRSVQTAEGGTSVGVESRVGFRVTTRVTGELTPSAAVENVRGSYEGSWNAFRPGQVSVSFDVVNEGNTRLFVDGTVSAGGSTVGLTDEHPEEVLPGDTRSLAVVVDGVWPWFAVPLEVAVVPEMLAMDGSTAVLDPVVVSVVVWAVPWPQLLLLLGAVLLVGAVLWGRRSSRRRLERMLEQARDEGRRSAVEDPAATP